ncbi:MAG: acyl-CoA synthetase FdrA [Bacillota bacterium]
MPVKVTVRKNTYYDSVTLMWLSREASGVPGMHQVVVVMGTDLNRELLDRVGLLDETARKAGPSDLIIALEAVDDRAIEAGEQAVEDLLKRRQELAPDAEHRYATLRSALQAFPEADLVSISIPGRYAWREAETCIKAGKHVFLFSDNVPLEQEVRLKRIAQERGLLLMGPDCGTAVISGVVLGFANVLRRGPIGVVAASGSGAQEVTSMIHNMGSGVAHVIGTGGRDLSREVGGLMMAMGISALARDSSTQVIVVISKPPHPEVSRGVLEVLRNTGKPAVVCFMGACHRSSLADGIWGADTLENSARIAVALAQNDDPASCLGHPSGWGRWVEVAAREARRLAPSQVFVRGLYSGGTLCDEAIHILSRTLGHVYSNTPLGPGLKVERIGAGHTILDLGDDAYTQGRAHPMIDPTLRQAMILDVAQDPRTSVLLLDCILGYGSHPDPGGSLVSSIMKAREIALSAGRHLPVVVSVCGTDLDPQNKDEQANRLRSAGALVLDSNAQTAAFAGNLMAEVGGTP